MSITLVLGGARSGKSRYAGELALRLSNDPIYLATSRPWDDDHRARILRHQRDRDRRFRTLEVEKYISRAALEADAVVVVDCLTLWLTNFFQDAGGQMQPCLDAALGELDRAFGCPQRWIFVSNEIGQGVHADTSAGREFTDLQGFVNQHVAAHAGAVVLMVAGIPLYVKGPPPP